MSFIMQIDILRFATHSIQQFNFRPFCHLTSPLLLPTFCPLWLIPFSRKDNAWVRPYVVRVGGNEMEQCFCEKILQKHFLCHPVYLISCVPAAFSDSDDAAENAFVTAFHRIMAMDHTAMSRPVLYCPPRLITLLLNSKEQGSFIAFLAFRLIYLLIKSFLFGTFLFVVVVAMMAVHF